MRDKQQTSCEQNFTSSTQASVASSYIFSNTRQMTQITNGFPSAVANLDPVFDEPTVRLAVGTFVVKVGMLVGMLVGLLVVGSRVGVVGSLVVGSKVGYLLGPSVTGRLML